ncbi:caspase family protein [Kordia jejudonensis]|uniref:caspase family protein n=1 Tax=Kordia jejudonensis TaxID=1348245 RepID=UPI000629085E|nr:caspase family protein [Kordia jejudonensis]
MKKAILLSVESYGSQPISHHLEGCHNDTREWEKVLIDFQFETNIKRDLTVFQALNEVRTFIKELNDNNVDTGVIVFSGHGFSLAGEEGLIFSDKEIYDYHILGELKRLNESTKMTIILDSCYAAGVPYATRPYMQLLGYSEEMTKKLPDENILLPYHLYKKVADYNITKARESKAQILDAIIVYSPKEHLTSLGYIDESIRELSDEKTLLPYLAYEEIVNFHTINIQRKSSEIINVVKEVQKSSLGVIGNTSYFSPTIKSPTLLSQEKMQIDKNRIQEKFKEIKDITDENSNITFMLAVEDASYQAYERLFEDGNHYGIFSYYTTKAIMKKKDSTYKEIVEIVNKTISDNELFDTTKKQRILVYPYDENSLNRKLFT